MEAAIAWAFLAGLVAVVAGTRGRSALGWFVLALVISPLLAIIAIVVLPNRMAQLRNADGLPIDPTTHVRCPDCREFVLRDARRCKHCGTALLPQ